MDAGVLLLEGSPPAYMRSSKKIFGKKTHHTANAGIRSKRTGQNFHTSNNKMERLNGEIRDREKVFRGLKKMDTSILGGMRVYGVVQIFDSKSTKSLKITDLALD